MSDFHIEDLSELERRMRAKLLPAGSEPVRSRLSEEDQRIAAKLMGSDNARRVASAREGRRVRLAPVVTVVEYWWVQSRDLRPSEWHIEVKVNYRREEKHTGTDPDELEDRLAEYRRRNIVTKEARLEGHPNRSRQ